MPGREMSCKYQMRMSLREAVLIRVSGRVLENGDFDEGRVDKDNQSNVSEVRFFHLLLLLNFFTNCIPKVS